MDNKNVCKVPFMLGVRDLFSEKLHYQAHSCVLKCQINNTKHELKMSVLKLTRKSITFGESLG